MCLLRRLRRHLLHEETGIALVMALGVSLVLGIMCTSVIAYTVANAQSANRSHADRQAFALAEAALNNARSVLFAAPDPRDPAAVPQASAVYTVGTATHSGVLNGSRWTLTGIGTARNPAGGASITRTLSTQIAVSTGQRSTENNAIWNYLYADALTGCSQLSNNAAITIPFYARGNVCMSNSATITSNYVQVGGTVTLSNQASIGSLATPIASARIAGGCSLSGGPLRTPCTAAERVYAQQSSSTPDPLVKPPVDLPSWYTSAAPGPSRACTTGSFPGGFDNDGVANRSRSTVDLTPAAPYNCTVRDPDGTIVGRLAWTPGQGPPAAGTLTIQGTIFFDGDIKLQNNANAVYQGRATIYSSGTIELSNNARLCGTPGCDASWNATTNLLALVAGSSSNDTGFAVSNDAKFQGAVYAVNDFRETNNGTVWGPIIARQLFISNSGLNHYVPLGTLLPGMPATYEEVTVLENVQGSFSG